MNTDHREERILLLVEPAEVREELMAILDRAELDAHLCRDGDQFFRELACGAGVGLLSQEALHPVTLRALTQRLADQPTWSDLPLVLLFSDTGLSTDHGLRMLDLLAPLGHVTVLPTPVEVLTLVSALQAGLRSRRRQYQVRDMLARREQAVRQREAFLNLLAHEVRNVLAPIRHATHILDQIGSAAPPAREQREMINRQTAHLARLLDDLLDFYRLTTGQLALRRRQIDLKRVAVQCVQALAPGLQAQRQRLAFTEGPAALPVDADPERLGQVIRFLVQHVAQDSPAGETINVSLGREEGAAVLTVRGKGKGPASEDFRDLLQALDGLEALGADSTDAGLKVGWGLVRGLVESHGGAVTLAAGEGQRTLLTVRLPLAAEAAEPIPPAPAAAPEAGRRLRVLIVEDNPDGRESLRLLLQLWGHQVRVAADGLQGVQKALADPPEVALIDLGLPGLDGFEVASRLRASLGNQVRLVAVTGYGRSDDPRRAQEAGFDTYLVKPVEPDQLRAALGGASPR